MNTALLIIDVQNIMFTHQDGVYRGNEVLDNIYNLLNKARASNVPVFFVKHLGNSEGGSDEDWNIHSKIQPFNGETIVEKTACDSFYKTDLHEKLQNKNVTKLVIAGMQTEFCVDTTCRRAFSMGYESVLVSDGHSTFDSEILKASQIIEHHNSIWDNRFAKLVLAEDVEFNIG